MNPIKTALEAIANRTHNIPRNFETGSVKTYDNRTPQEILAVQAMINRNSGIAYPTLASINLSKSMRKGKTNLIALPPDIAAEEEVEPAAEAYHYTLGSKLRDRYLQDLTRGILSLGLEPRSPIVHKVWMENFGIKEDNGRYTCSLTQPLPQKWNDSGYLDDLLQNYISTGTGPEMRESGRFFTPFDQLVLITFKVNEKDGLYIIDELPMYQLFEKLNRLESQGKPRLIESKDPKQIAFVRQCFDDLKKSRLPFDKYSGNYDFPTLLVANTIPPKRLNVFYLCNAPFVKHPEISSMVKQQVKDIHNGTYVRA